MSAISQTFGRGIWRRTVLVLTHGNLPQTPPGTDYGEQQTGPLYARAACRCNAVTLWPIVFRTARPRIDILTRMATSAPRVPRADSFADGRIRRLRGGVRTLLFRPALPAVLAENSDTCPVAADGSGHRVLPDGSEWLLALMGEIVDLSLARRSPYK